MPARYPLAVTLTDDQSSLLAEALDDAIDGLIDNYYETPEDERDLAHIQEMLDLVELIRPGHRIITDAQRLLNETLISNAVEDGEDGDQ